MTHKACESKLYSVVVLSMHTCPGNSVAIGVADAYYVLAAQALSSGINVGSVIYHKRMRTICTIL